MTRLFNWLHPDRKGGMTGVRYALLSALLLIALLLQSQGMAFHAAGMGVPSGQSDTAPWVGMRVPGTNRTVPAHLNLVANTTPLAPLSAEARAYLTPAIRPDLVTFHVDGVSLSTGQNVTATINALADKFGVPATDIVATAMAESGLDPFSERWAAWPDDSCGLMQQIIANVTSLTGITDSRAACNWEEVPYNSLWYGALILAQDQRDHPGVPWPNQYVFYNAGDGQPDWFALAPTGQAWTNLFNNFIPNWYLAQSRYASAGPPPPPPTPRPKPKPFYFPDHTWCRYASAHHTACPSPWYRHHLSIVAASWLWGKTIQHNCAGIIGPEHWFAGLRVMRTDFSHCVAYSWPSRHTRAVKWLKRVGSRLIVLGQQGRATQAIKTARTILSQMKAEKR